MDRRLYPTLFCLCQPILLQSEFGFPTAAAAAANAAAAVTRRYLHIYVQVQTLSALVRLHDVSVSTKVPYA